MPHLQRCDGKRILDHRRKTTLEADDLNLPKIAVNIQNSSQRIFGIRFPQLGGISSFPESCGEIPKSPKRQVSSEVQIPCEAYVAVACKSRRPDHQQITPQLSGLPDNLLSVEK